MQRSIYIRPVGLFEPPGDEDPGEIWGGLPLAGGPLSFAAIEVIERAGTGARRRVIGLGNVFERDWGRNTIAASDLLEAIRAPRPRIAGLSLARPRIMGIVNVTPDSFSDGGNFYDPSAAIAHGLKLAEEGADILDIGGELTRPGSDAVGLDEELRRVLPVLEGLRARTDKLISIDTRKAEVMSARGGGGRRHPQRCLSPDARSGGARRSGGVRTSGHPHARAGRSEDHERQSAIFGCDPGRVRFSGETHQGVRGGGDPQGQAGRRSGHRVLGSTCITTFRCCRR